MPAEPALTAVVPLKAIARAKTRMAPALDADERAELLRRTFDRVVAAAAAASAVGDVLVVVGDAEGRRWAAAHGVPALDEHAGGGLNAALAQADEALGDRPTLVIPADLPLVSGADLDAVAAAAAGTRCVVVVATADGGTGALLRRPGGVVGPCYGPGSARAHLAAAAAAGVPGHLVRIPGLALDLDRPADLARAGGWSALRGGRTLAS